MTDVFAFLHVIEGLTPRAIFIPLDAIRPKNPILFKCVQRARQLVEQNMAMGKSDAPFIKPDSNDVETGTLRYWADASYNLYDYNHHRPLYFWVEDATWYFGGVPQPRYMLDKLKNMATCQGLAICVKEVVVCTEVDLDAPLEFNCRFFYQGDKDKIRSALKDLGWSKIMLARETKPKSGYGFMTTSDEPAWKRATQQKTIDIGEGTIVID